MQLEEIKTYFQGVTRERNNSFMCKCPVPTHGDDGVDSTPTVCVSTGDKQPLLIKCQGGCETEDILKAVGLTFKDICEDTPIKTDGLSLAKSYYESKGLEFVEAYTYKDENGKYLYHRVRFKEEAGKTFRYIVVDGDKWKSELGKIKRSIYKLETINNSDTIYVPEGEKDVNTLINLGFTAVTFGSAGDWKRTFSKYFKDKNVILLPDNDKSGIKGMNTVYQDLKGIAKSVNIVTVSERKKGDVTDFFKDGYTLEDFNDIVNKNINDNVNVIDEEINFLDDKGNVIPYYLSKAIAEKHNVISDKISMYYYNDGVYSLVQPNTYNFIDDMVLNKCQISVRLINETTSLVRNMTFKNNIEQTDGYINFKNGLINIQTRNFEELTKDIISFGKVPYVYDPNKADIKGTRFEEFITSSLSEEMLPVIQELIGVCLYPVTHKRAYFYILHGEGRNGKGVLLDIINHMIPDCLKSNITIADYDKRFINSAIKGKTLNLSMDDNTTRLEGIGNLKSVSACESIYVEEKGKDGMSIKPRLTHISAFNKLPSMSEKENAFFDRAITINFKYTFGNAEQVAAGEKDKLEDVELKQYILDNEMDKIVSWGLHGLFRLIDNNYVFTTNEELRVAKEDYRCKVDSVREWAKTTLSPIEGEFKNSDLIKSTDLYKRYTVWCADCGVDKPVGRNAFLDSMKRVFPRHHKTYNKQLHFAIINS